MSSLFRVCQLVVVGGLLALLTQWACVIGTQRKCQTDQDCFLPTPTCIEGVCGACIVAGDCPPGKICQARQCVLPSVVPDSAPPEEPAPEPIAEEPPPEPQPPEVRPDGYCTSSDDCSDGQVCSDFSCGPCGSDDECTKKGQTCLLSQCIISTKKQDDVFLWNDDTYAPDCASYRFPGPGYSPAQQNGLYWLKPANAEKPFKVHCNMAIAGGGWTLVLKVDGSKETFKYSSPLWVNKLTYNDDNPSSDTTEAKLQSFHTVEVQDILIGMRSPFSSPIRYVTLRKNATSFHAIMNEGKNIQPDVPADSSAWRSLLRDPSLQPGCSAQGFNLEFSNGFVRSLRVGFVGNEQTNCDSPDSFIGIGQSDPTRTIAGNFSLASGADNGAQDTKAFAYIYVRTLKPANDKVLSQHQNAWRYQDGSYAKNCLAYRFPPAAATKNGAYWIQPKTDGKPFKVYCEQQFRSGGWTLALKSRGDRKTLAYDAALWTNEDTLNPSSVNTDTSNAKFESFSTVPFREVMLLLRTPIFPETAEPQSISLSSSGASLFDIFKFKSHKAFNLSMGRILWKSMLGTLGSLQPNCHKEGFNVASTGNYAHVRIGMIANNAASCEQANSFIGIGGKDSQCSVSAGNCADGTGDNGARDLASFGMLFVR